MKSLVAPVAAIAATGAVAAGLTALASVMPDVPRVGLVVFEDQPGDPASDAPAAGQPAPGAPAAGQPAPGAPAAGQPAPATPAAGQPAVVPTSAQLSTVLYTLADPGVPFANKSDLVQGGIAPFEATVADHELQKANRKGELPLAFQVTNIQPAGPGAATADVTVSGPKLAPRTMDVDFVNQDGWELSHDSAISLLQAASAK